MPTPELIAMNDPIPTETTSLHVPLDKPPAAFSITVRKLLGRVQAGEVRVPPFQRPLRWSAADVVKLFDSILKGYPVGSLLFWKQQLPADPTLLIGNALLNVPETTDGWYIVDGQQRTTALAAALLELDHRGKTTWSLRYDPKTNEFLHGPADPLLARRQVPLPALGDLRRLSRWLRDCDLDDAAQSRLEEVQQRLLDYELPAYLMETDDGEALRGVFARLNSTGVRMRADEVFEALLGTSGKRQESKRDLAALQQACDLENFGQLPRSEVLKALLAMSGVDPTRRFEDLGEQAASHLAPQEEATEALARTVAFLQAPVDALEPGAGIPAYAFLPYPIAFVILASWFRRFPEPDAATRRSLARWLWRGVAGGVHQRAAVSALRAQLRYIDDDMESSLRRLLDAVGSPPTSEWVLDSFHARHAASRVEMLMLLERQPRDRLGPVSWEALVSSGERISREIIRSHDFRKLPDVDQKLATTAANRVLLDARHTGLGAEFKSWSWAKDEVALESHLIDQTSLNLLTKDDLGQFLKHRASRVRVETGAFLSRRAGVGEPLLLPLESYLDSAEGAE